jgi:hypothetical protein
MVAAVIQVGMVSARGTNHHSAMNGAAVFVGFVSQLILPPRRPVLPILLAGVALSIAAYLFT